MSDEALMYACSVATACLIAICYKINKSAAVKHLIIFILYSAYLYYGLFYRSEYGAALGWWFFIILTTAIHGLVLLLYILYNLLKK